jgi:replicative superfamily II helicase
LDQEQLNILEQINQSDKPLICIRALAGAGKTAVAHCLLHTFLSSTAKDTPRKLAFFTVPTRELREEVVLELIRSKAPMHVATVPSLHQPC